MVKVAPVVSVILPAFNAGPFVEAAVRSILVQTFRDFELILVDDGSTDGTGDILRRLAGEDSRIRLVQRENRGLVASLNEGLALARGKYIARMDADDISAPTRFERQVAYLEANHDVVLVGVRVWSMPSERWRGRVISGRREVSWGLYFYCDVAHPGVMFRADIARIHGLRYDPEYDWAEDYRLWFEVAGYGFLDNLPQPLLFYRRHPGAVSRVHAERQQTLTRRLQAMQFQRRFGVDLADVLTAEPYVWAMAVRDRLFASPAYAGVAADDRAAIHAAFQWWSARFGFRFAVGYVRRCGVDVLRAGPCSLIRYGYRVVRRELLVTLRAFRAGAAK